MEEIQTDAKQGKKAAIQQFSNSAFSFASEPDDGMYDAINRGWASADGDVLSWLNADEQYLPGALAKVAAAFDAHQEVDAVWGNTLIVDANGEAIAARREIPLRRVYVRNGFLYALSCTCFFRRRLWDGGLLQLNDGFRYSADADLILRLLEAGTRFHHLDEYLALFSITGENLSFSPAMKAESEAIKRSHGALRSSMFRRAVLAGRHIERLLRGCYGARRVSYRYALNEVPNYRAFENVKVGTAFSYENHR